MYLWERMRIKCQNNTTKIRKKVPKVSQQVVQLVCASNNLIPMLLANTQTCYEEHKHVALFGVWCGC